MYYRIKLLIIAFIATIQSSFSQNNNYIIGAGISDVTGQIAESNFFGYGKPFFRNSGIRDRQYARAYIVKDRNENSVVFVSIDKGATFQSVNLAVINKLAALYGSLYTDKNVIISATHTHVSPGGYSHFSLYNTATGGHYKKNFRILVDGIVKAIEQAHQSLAPGRIYYNRGTLTNASINRSLVAYNLNKDAKNYKSIDEEITVLKFVQENNKEIGMISWFGVHPTNLSQTYKYCSSDNKGFAALKFERMKKSTYGKGSNTFVAAFANTNAGDMSPNLHQPAPDDLRSDAKGPGKNEEESSEIIGNRQFYKSLELYKTATEQLVGSVNAVTRYTDFSNIEIAPTFTNGETQHTCRAALGLSFRAGAEDARSGLGKEGKARKNPTSGLKFDVCHGHKMIDPLFILDSGYGSPKTPKILPTSIMKIGQLGLLAGPGEFTIMSGRRIKQTVATYNKDLRHLVFCGYADAYSGYITTHEEYASQQYEGASTHFGPWTLAAYRQEFYRLAKKLNNPNANHWPLEEPTPPKKSFIGLDKTVNIMFDDKPLNKKFGDTFKDVNSIYNINDEAEVIFWGGHPNHDEKTNDTYFTIEKQIDNNWTTVYEDRDPNTKLIWKRTGVSFSKIIIRWKITNETESGYYRIKHTGKWKNGWNGKLYDYQSISKTFYVKGKKPANNSKPYLATIKKNPIKKTTVYPNAVTDILTVINEKRMNAYYEIHNYLGSIVQKGNISKARLHTINIKAPKGLYLLAIHYIDGTSTQNNILKK